MLSDIVEIKNYSEFLKQFTLQQITSRYRGSVLGFLWTLLTPALFFLVLGFVFSAINKADMRTFGIYFFAGYMPFYFFQNAVTFATTSITGFPAYVTRVFVPKTIFPSSAVMLCLPDLAAGFAFTLVLMLVTGAPFTPALAVLPFSFLLLLTFTIGLAYLAATLNVFFRDFQFVWQTVSFLLFFISPILWKFDQLTPEMQRILALNPLLPFLRMFQDPIVRGVVPPAEQIVLALIYAGVSLMFGFSVFRRSQQNFYLYL